MLKQIMLGVLLVAMMVPVAFAAGTVVVDANGRVVGPLGHSATIPQGVVFNANNGYGQVINILTGATAPAPNFWLLIPVVTARCPWMSMSGVTRMSTGWRRRARPAR